MDQNSFLNNMPGADKDGLNVGLDLKKVNVLNNTDVGILRKKNNKDKSTYTVTTKPDGTVVEEVKMNKKSNVKGVVDTGTDGIKLDGLGAKAGLGEKSQEDAVAFVDSIWGSKQAAGKIADRRANEKLGDFKNQRQAQLASDSATRKQNVPQLTQKANTPGKSL